MNTWMTVEVQDRKALFLKACQCQPVERVPVWIMRQAGRYLPEYRALREKHSFLECCKTPELAAEVSLQPLRCLGVDAVIVFSDILIVAEAMGLPLDVPETGPVLGNPVRDRQSVEKLRIFDPLRETRFVGDAIREVCRNVGPTVPVIGFAAAPWTLACYMVEGQTRGELATIKSMMYAEPALLRALLNRIAQATVPYLRAQLDAEATAVQLFDTWAGELSREEYDAFALPVTRRIIEELRPSGAPVILYSRGTSHLLDSLAATTADVLSVDWRVDLADARRRLGPRVALQGNVDPRILLTRPEIVKDAAGRAIAKTNGLGHILNLGHGVLPATPVENAQAFVQAARDTSVAAGAGPGRAEARESAGGPGELVSSNSNSVNARTISEVTEDFVAKYNRPGPRYTSYPTAPVWKDNFGPEDFEDVCATADSAGTPVSLYMHIPFCESLCLFCACTVSIQKNHQVTVPYLDSLKKEIERVSRLVSKSRHVVQFHWGGGTPTYLTPAQMEDLFEFTRERFTFASDTEIGIEVDPRVTSLEHLETLRRLGFNRLSMGLQDFNPLVQQTVHRVQPYDMTRELIEAARALRFDSMNVDLIYGLPYQTAASFGETVDKVLVLNPDRVAMFSYAHVPWLKKQQGSFAGHLPEGMEKFQIFRTGLEKFVAAGYEYIGMDHFARPGDELAVAQRHRTLHRNFQGYTTKSGADLYGMGVSAISGIGNAYAQNYREVPQYEDAIAQRGIATMRGYRLTVDDRIRRAVIGRLLCHTVVRMREIEEEFKVSFGDYFAPELAQLEECRADGLLAEGPGEIRVTPLGRIFIRNVGMVFDRFLREQQMDSRPLFSKTL